MLQYDKIYNTYFHLRTVTDLDNPTLVGDLCPLLLQSVFTVAANTALVNMIITQENQSVLCSLCCLVSNKRLNID